MAFLTNRCGTPSSFTTETTTLDRALAYAIAQIDQQTGYDPFLSGSASDALVEVVGQVGRFDNGAVGTVAISYNGTTYVAGTDYRLYPLNKNPKHYVKWLRALPPGGPVTVNASWGYASDYPDDVWQAIVMIAASFCLVAWAAGKAGYMGSSWTDGDVQANYAVGNRLATEQGISQMAPGILDSEASAILAQYRRTVAWG